MKNIILIALVAITFCSCSTVKHNATETYTVQQVKKVANGHSTVKLKGLGGWVELASDTLKRNDVITVVYLNPVNRFKRK